MFARSFYGLLLTAALFGIATGAQARSIDVDLSEIVAQAESVDEAVTKVGQALERRRYEIVLTVNHAAAAANVGLDLRPTQVIFARPRAFLERLALRRSDTLGIDLPLKVLIFENADGDIEARHNPIGYLIDRHSLPIYDFALSKLDRGVSDVDTPPNGLVTIPSTRSVAETVNALRAAIEVPGVFRIPLELNYAKKRGQRAPTLLVFGNPGAGTLLMQTTQEIAIDLPQKMLVWQDDDGRVFITYNDPFFIADRAGIPAPGDDVDALNARLTAISGALANFAATAAGNN